MDKLWSKMEMENQYNQTIMKEDFDAGMEYTIKKNEICCN